MRTIAFLFILPVILCINDDESTVEWMTALNARQKNSLPSRTGDNQRPNLTPTKYKKKSGGSDQAPTHRDGRVSLSPTNVIPSNGGQFRKNNVSLGTGGNESPNLNPTRALNGLTCLTKEERNGECVSYFLCNENKKIIVDGTDIIDLRNNECSHYLEVCCELDLISDKSDEDDTNFDSVPTELPTDLSSPSIPTTSPIYSIFLGEAQPRPIHRPSNRPTNRPSQTIPTTDTFFHPGTQEKVPRSECGWSNLAISPHERQNPNSRPTNITDAFYGEYPFMVAVMKKTNSDVWSNSDYIGGGVLIHYRVVITVAHKVKMMEASKVKCRAGEYDTQTTKEEYPHQERTVDKIIVHENYYRRSLFNDIALLFLVSEFSPAPNVGIACLASVIPQQTDDCYSMGWGRILSIDHRNQFALILKKVPLPLVSSSECQNMLRENSRLGPLFNLHESLSCAGGEADIDVCKGDGGAPLVCAVKTNGQEKRYVVTGLVAVGINCGHEGIPGLYTNIPHLYSWIVKQLDEEKIEKQFVL